ncbi:uncharacterized protein V6R79_007422 [Siganus canaliculatus]
MSVDSVFRTRSLGVAAEGLPDQYADGKAAKVWELYIGDTQSRTQEYKSWVVSLLKKQGVRRVLDVACGTGAISKVNMAELHISQHTGCCAVLGQYGGSGIEPVVRGIIGSAAIAVTAGMMVPELTERLVVLSIPQHMDLASLNLQRGRDHGLPGYNDWISFCGLKRVKTLEDFKEVARNDLFAEMIFQMYKTPDHIDVWLGGLVEKFLPGSRTGPLFACLIGKQMKVLRDGDRFWWEAKGKFTQQQKAELVKVSLSRVICDNSDIKEVPRDPFIFGKYPTDYTYCDRVASMNLEAWREEKSRGGLDPKVTTRGCKMHPLVFNC